MLKGRILRSSFDIKAVRWISYLNFFIFYIKLSFFKNLFCVDKAL